MLVLSRKVGEKIMIGDDIEITVIESRTGKLRLGITCPKHIPIYREEIYNLIKKKVEGKK